MIYKTPIDDVGLFQLGIIQDFFKRMKIPLSEVKVSGEYFDLDMRFMTEFERDFPRFHEFIAVQGLCPVVGTRIRLNSNFQLVPHSVVIDTFVARDDAGFPYYRCKNTDKNDRKLNVGFSNRPDVYPIFEAILIQF